MQNVLYFVATLCVSYYKFHKYKNHIVNLEHLQMFFENIFKAYTILFMVNFFISLLGMEILSKDFIQYLYYTNIYPDLVSCMILAFYKD